jgi:hypothetical protein
MSGARWADDRPTRPVGSAGTPDDGVKGGICETAGGYPPDPVPSIDGVFVGYGVSSIFRPDQGLYVSPQPLAECFGLRSTRP